MLEWERNETIPGKAKAGPTTSNKALLQKKCIFGACGYFPMSCLKQIRKVWDLFAFHLRSALLRCLLMDWVCTLSYGWGLCFWNFCFRGFKDVRNKQAFLLNCWSHHHQRSPHRRTQAGMCYRGTTTLTQSLKRLRGAEGLRAAGWRGAFKYHSFAVWQRDIN